MLKSKTTRLFSKISETYDSKRFFWKIAKITANVKILYFVKYGFFFTNNYVMCLPTYFFDISVPAIRLNKLFFQLINIQKKI